MVIDPQLRASCMVSEMLLKQKSKEFAGQRVLALPEALFWDCCQTELCPSEFEKTQKIN